MALQTANQYGLGIDGVGLSNRLLKIMQANKVDAATAQTAKAEALQQQLKTTGAQLLHIRNNIEGKEAQKKAIANLATEKINQGQDSGIYDELLNIDDPDLLNTRMTQIIIRATDADKQLEKGLGIGSKTKPKTYQPITLVKRGEKGEVIDKKLVMPKYDANTDTASLEGLDIPAGYEISTETPEEKRAADAITDVDVAEDKEDIKTKGAREREGDKKQIEFDWAARIEERVQIARAKATAKGEALTDLEQMEAALPELEDVVGRLKDLSQVATYTTAGRVWDTMVRELGFPATEGATARAKYVATIQNVVLPLLKPTFGAAFTVGEGEKLEATLGDPNATPEEKQAALESFIEQKERNIRATARKAGVSEEMTDEDLQELERLRQKQGNL